MSYKAYEDSQRLSTEESLEAIIMTYMRKADDTALTLLKIKHPGIWDELQKRYNAPGGKLEGEIEEDLKKEIDRMSYESMLKLWRFGDIGNRFFVGEIGDYFSEIMNQKKNKTSAEEHTAISKRIGHKR